jgi:hypothetical protein
MGIYARRPWRFLGQLSADLFVLLWVGAWALLGRLAHRNIVEVAEPARDTATAAGKLSTQLAEAADQAGRVPGVGQQLRQPFDAAAGPLGDVITAAKGQVAGVERLADLMGWLVFLIPVTIVLALWLPRRIAFVARDLFALRAMVSQPMHVLAQISPDPVAAWRAGDATVIHKLAEVELHRSGLRMPTSASAERVPEGG